MNHVRLRQGALADLLHLENVEGEAAAIFPASALPPDLATVSREAFIEGISHSLLWVAETGVATIVGFLLARRECGSLHVVEMDVLPEYGRQGVGTRLLQEACNVAAAQGVRFITLTTFEHLPWNAPFYAKRGFLAITDPSAFPHLAAALQRESENGLERRIAMVKKVGLTLPVNLIVPHLRIARPVTDLSRAQAMYCQGLGLRVIGSFEDHDGFDGVMLGLAGASYHFEFTRCRTHPVIASPTPEDLVVLYVPMPVEWEHACVNMLAAGFKQVASFNPYWDLRGRTFEDFDGYRVVLQNTEWGDVTRG